MRRITSIIVGAITFLACIVFVATLAQATLHYQNENETDSGIPPASKNVVAHSNVTPMRLVIPSLDIDAQVQDVGLGKSGNMAVPSNYTDVGWYRYGPLPGEVGSAVIDGHVDNGFGMDAVFKNISELQPGDDIYIDTKGKDRTHFVVTDIKTYDVADVPRDLLFSRADTARLNLITCNGEWDSDAKSYDKRTVVYAVQELD